jgi:hypothetical protein
VTARYDVELSPPSSSRCDCCGGLTVKLTRFVHRDGDAFAIYYATYANNHPDHEIAMLVSLGDWGDSATPDDRAAFYCRIRPSGDSYEVMLGDAASSPWADAAIVGTKLSRAEALRHPWKATAFEVLDSAFPQDPSLQGFLQRIHSGDAAQPLERNYGMPDEVFALGDARTGRAQLSKSFVILDRERFFVRCLLPIAVEGYDTWSVGLWIEVSRTDFEHVYSAWDDAAAYPTLRFTGSLANDVATDLGLPLPPGTMLRLHVRAPDEPPQVAGLAPTGELPPALTETWSRAAFEELAVARGLL